MNAAKFWNVFSSSAARLAAMFHSGEQQQVFATVEELLEQNGIDYCFDITADDRTCFLVFSPEGDESAASEIDNLISCATSIPDWKIYGRRQRKHINDVRAILKQLYLVDVFQCRFLYSSEKNPDRIEIFVPVSSDLTSEEQDGFANTLLWHAIGEDFVMNNRLQAVVRMSIPERQQLLSAQDLVKKALESGRKGPCPA